MKYFINLKISIDWLTGSISDFCSNKNVRYVLLAIKWAAAVFILYDFYVYGRETGNTIIFVTVFTIAVASLLTKKK